MPHSTNQMLNVPVHLDVLVLSEDTDLNAPLLDFTKIPWGASDPGSDDDPGYKPYLSETIAATPLASTSSNKVSMPKGTHLHWALPNALTSPMLIPLVRKQSFVNVFGAEDGATIWANLHDHGWILPNAADPRKNAGFAVDSDKRKLPDQASTIITSNLQAIHSLLDAKNFPPAPNRWLITRKTNGTVAKQWVLESDGIVTESASLATVYPVNTRTGDQQPFLYLGKSSPFANWSEPDAAGTSTVHLANPLTAVGFGESAFAAFYSNSKQVFGFHDENIGTAVADYEIIGWYSRADLDYFRSFQHYQITKWESRWGTKGDDTSQLFTNPIHYKYIDLIKAVDDTFGWNVGIQITPSDLNKIIGTQGTPYATAWDCLVALKWIDANGQLLPKGYSSQRILTPHYRSQAHIIDGVLNAAIKVQFPEKSVFFAAFGERDSLPPPPAELPDVRLAIGNTGAEAMSALLGAELGSSGEVQLIIEDHLEALQLRTKLMGRILDVGPKFKEFRHAKTFTGEYGGALWRIHSRSSTNNKAAQSAPPHEVTLPEKLGDLLNELNLLQQAYDKVSFRIESLRERVFSDWCAFQEATHKPKAVKDPVIEPPGGGNGGGVTIGGPGDGDDGGITINAVNNEESDIASKLTFTQEIKDLIHWEVSVLNQRIADRQQMMTALANQHTKVQQALAAHQTQQQLVSEVDINDWPKMVMQLSKANPNLPPNLVDQLKKKLPTLTSEDKAACIQVLNTWLQGADLAINFTPPRTSAAYETLKNKQVNWSNGDAIRYKRLLLELCLPELRHRPRLIIEKSAAPRYYRPNDPVVLISGIQPSPRHGKTRPVVHNTPNWMQGDTMSPASFDAFEALKWEKALKSPAGATDWHPILLDWEVEFSEIKEQKVNVYEQGYLTDHYQLGLIDFSSTDTSPQYDESLSFYGRSILTPYGHLSIRNVLAEALTGDMYSQFSKDEQIKGRPTLKQFEQWVHSFAPTMNGLPESVPDRNPTNQITAWLQATLAEGGQEGLSLASGFLTKKLQKEDTIVTNFLAQHPGDLATQVDAWINWCLDQLKTKQQAIVRTSFHRSLNLLAYQKVATMTGLSQVFGGFDLAMLQHKQALQLAVKDPFPMDGDQTFAPMIRAAVQTSNKAAPQNGLPFAPIRAGKMKIGRMLLIDNFGQSWGWGKDGNVYPPFVAAKSMRGDNNTEALLAPRFPQATRLNFRWLSAWHDLIESNDHPATNPICGWVLPNNLDASLMIYGPRGEAYGYIDQSGIWRVFPGNSGPVTPGDITNPYLSKMVRWLCQKGKAATNFIEGFILKLNAAMENIAPENFAQHEALSLLMGTPMALVRAAVNLELKKDYAINITKDQFAIDYNKFQEDFKGVAPDPKLDLAAFPRSTFQYEKIQVPVRIGEYRQFNDGTVGYWSENPNGVWSDTFHIPESQNPPPDLQLQLSEEAPLIVNMLLDPRGKVHATCGLQPVKEIHLPPDQYAGALQAIEIAFLTTPILTPSTGIHLSLPKEPGYSWSWIMQQGNSWREVGTQGIVSLNDLEKVFKAQASTIWQLLLTKGWIIPIASNRAQIVPDDQRRDPQLGTAFQALEAQIEVLLDSCHISAADPSARFKGKNELREGWLKLSKST